MNDNLVAKSCSLSHMYGVKMNENLVAKEPNKCTLSNATLMAK